MCLRDGLEIASLVPREAEIATRHALLWLNGFPSWFSELIAHHEEIVKNLLREVSRDGLYHHHKESPAWLLSALRYHKPELPGSFFELLTGLLLEKPVKSHEPLEHALIILRDRSPSNLARLTTVFAARARDAFERDNQALLLRWTEAWFWRDAEEAWSFTDDVLRSDHRWWLRHHVVREGLIRSREIEALGYNRQYLTRATRDGRLERVARGLYASPDATIQACSHLSLAIASRLFPNAVVSLLSALHYHGLTTALPADVWMTIEEGSREPSTRDLSMQFVRASKVVFSEGQETRWVGGARDDDTRPSWGAVAIRIYTPTKTVVDCFRYRSQVGEEIALQALNDFFTRSPGRTELLWRTAKKCGVESILRDHLKLKAVS